MLDRGEVEVEAAVLFGDGEGFQGGDDPGGGTEIFGGVGSEDGQDAAFGGDAGAYAGGGVLDDDTVGGGEAEQGGAAPVGFGVGLAVGDHVGGDEVLGDGEGDGGEAAADEALSAGGDDGPAIGWEAGEEGADAGEDFEVGGVGDFELFDDAEGFDGIDVGAELGDDVLGADAVGDLIGVGVGDVVEGGPAAPAADDGADGRDEDAVVVEEDGFGFDVEGGAQAGAPSSTNFLAAARMRWTDSGVQLSQ